MMPMAMYKLIPPECRALKVNAIVAELDCTTSQRRSQQNKNDGRVTAEKPRSVWLTHPSMPDLMYERKQKETKG